MKKLPAALRFILNIIFFVIYSLIWVIIWNFLFWLVLTSMWNTVPWSSDPIHMKIAWIVVLIILICSILLRKYFYISLEIDKNDNIEIKEEKNEDEMKIYVDKEIK
jgi:hypothetical protein